MKTAQRYQDITNWNRADAQKWRRTEDIIASRVNVM